MEGSFLRCFVFSAELVSPVRSATEKGTPNASTASRSAAAVSDANARKGVIQITRMGSVSSDDSGSPNLSSNGPTMAANVFPLPVGE